MNGLIISLMLPVLFVSDVLAQNTVISWSALDMGFAVPTSATTELRSVAGQVVIGTTLSSTTRLDAGLLVGPAFSQSGLGAVIVYSRSGTSEGTIWMKAVDGSFDVQITSGEWPRMSHNGRYIVFHKGSGEPNRRDMNLYDRQIGRDTLLFQNSSDYINTYDWLEDDYHIVFDFSCSMMMINRDRTGTTKLYQVDCNDDAPVVRPGSRAIAFHNAFQGIMLTDSLGTNRHHVPNTGGGNYWPAWSPDGQWISFGAVFSDSIGNYYKIHPDGTGLTQLTSFTAGQSVRFGSGGAWTSDGTKLLVPGRMNGTQGIYAIATDGSGGIGLVPTAPGDPIDFVGTVTGNVNVILTDVSGRHPDLPSQYQLNQNYPNPFNPSTTISFAVPHQSHVRVTIHNVLGQEVATLADEQRPAGYFSVEWNGKNRSGGSVSSGVYFYRMEAMSVNGGSKFFDVKKMLLLK